MIRQAPASFMGGVLIGSLILGFLAYHFIDSHFEGRLADMGTANTRLDSTIKSLQATIQYQSTQIADMAGKQPKGDRSVAVSRLQNAGIQLLPGKDFVQINVKFKNVGTAPAVGFINSFSGLIATGELADDRLDEIFLALKSKLKDLESRHVDTEIQVDDQVFFTIELPSIPMADLDSKVKNGTNVSYLLLMGEYRDTSTPPDKWRVTELCQYTFKDQAMHFCGHHNRIYLGD